MAVVRRQNQKVLAVLRAALVGLFTAAGLGAMSARPAWLMVVVGAIVVAASLFSADVGVLVAVCALSVPVIAAQPVLGFAVLIVLVASVRFLGTGGARNFLIIALALTGAFVGPVWAAVALAGLLLGAGEGALIAGIACVVLEVIGIALGKPVIGATITGGLAAKGHTALVSFAQNPSLLSPAWITRAMVSTNAASVGAVTTAFSKVGHGMALVIQPVIWALGAAVTGAVAGAGSTRRSRLVAMGGIVAGVAVAAVGSMALANYLHVDLHEWVAVSAVWSILLAVPVAIALDLLFPVTPATAKSPARTVSMATEDADVDELLRLIATAEEKLASQHTSERVVMITDMKAFSRMTEEDGSVATAKAIQRHRDLLLPIVTQHRGAGKSTGGDGLVAAFESADDAVTAAVEMQQVLARYNATHPDERELWIRIGLASGEVVLDKGGRPFIGAGLNLAARVMNLADGGQIFATGTVISSAELPDIPTVSFGEFELKNIHRPVEILELLWDDHQEPRDPRETGAAETTAEG